MIKFENTEVTGWEAAIRGMRNPMNSWEKSDSGQGCSVDFVDRICVDCDRYDNEYEYGLCRHDKYVIGPNDLDLMRRLASGGPVHAKYRRMITVYVDITAPLYWWKEFDTYKVGTVANSCSTMHKIADKEFTLEDFSTEHLYSDELEFFKEIVDRLNGARNLYLASKKGESPRTVKDDWWQMIQLLPSSYNQKRTVMMNYEVLANIYKSRRNHKLDEWAEHNPMILGIDTDEGSYSLMGFCDWIKTLPYTELICGENLYMIRKKLRQIRNNSHHKHLL